MSERGGERPGTGPGQGGDEGAPRVRGWITTDPIRPGALLEKLGTTADGAVVLFLGRVRDATRGRRVLRLEYEAYREMAERELRRMAEAVASEHGAGGAIAVHRTGALEPGEASVAVAVAAPHRAEAFAAARDLMERIKERLPVWKRERYEDGGSEWVGTGLPTRRAGGTGA